MGFYPDMVTLSLGELLDEWRHHEPEHPDTDDGYLDEVALTLRRHGADGVAFLRSQLDHRDDVRVSAAILGLSSPSLADPNVPRALLGQLGDSRPRVRSAAIRGLASNGRREALPRVLAMRADASPLVRCAMLEFVRQFDPKHARSLLLSALADGEATPNDMTTLRPHLRACASCRATLKEYRSAPARVAALFPPLALLGIGPGGGSLGDRWGSLVDGAQERGGEFVSRLQGQGSELTSHLHDRATALTGRWHERGAGLHGRLQERSAELTGRLQERAADLAGRAHASAEVVTAQKVAAVAASTAALAGGGVATVRSLDRPAEPQRAQLAEARERPPREAPKPPRAAPVNPTPAPVTASEPAARASRATRRARPSSKRDRAKPRTSSPPPQQAAEFEPSPASYNPPRASAAPSAAPAPVAAPPPQPSGGGGSGGGPPGGEFAP